MSASVNPITPEQFAAALESLPLGSLHSKAAEIRNAIAHLQTSNEALQGYANDGDKDCAEALEENQLVITRMEERVELLKVEVERRGYMWEERGVIQQDSKTNDQNLTDHSAVRSTAGGNQTQGDASEQAETNSARRLGDDELARRLRERMDTDESTGGLHM